MPESSGTGSAATLCSVELADDDAGSLGAIQDGTLSTLKAELLSHVRVEVENLFRRCGVDATWKEVGSIALASVELGAVDVSEIYSPHRVTAMAQKFGLRPGFAVDLVEDKPAGYGSGKWNLDLPEDVELLRVM